MAIKTMKWTEIYPKRDIVHIERLVLETGEKY